MASLVRPSTHCPIKVTVLIRLLGTGAVTRGSRQRDRQLQIFYVFIFSEFDSYISIIFHSLLSFETGGRTRIILFPELDYLVNLLFHLGERANLSGHLLYDGLWSLPELAILLQNSPRTRRIQNLPIRSGLWRRGFQDARNILVEELWFSWTQICWLFSLSLRTAVIQTIFEGLKVLFMTGKEIFLVAPSGGYWTHDASVV